MNEWMFYTGAAFTSILYAALLEWFDKAWEPDWTWFVVFVGVVYTGCWVGALARWGDLPLDLAPLALVWWVCWRWVYMFFATGLPIIIWQVWQMRRRLLDALRYARGE